MKKKPICNTAGEKIAPEGNIRRRSRAFQPTPQAVCRLVLRRTTGKAKFVIAKNKVSGNIKVQRSLSGDIQTPFSVGASHLMPVAPGTVPEVRDRHLSIQSGRLSNMPCKPPGWHI